MKPLCNLESLANPAKQRILPQSIFLSTPLSSESKSESENTKNHSAHEGYLALKFYKIPEHGDVIISLY